MKQYNKIDIYVKGVYVCSTTRSKTLKEAKANFLGSTYIDVSKGIYTPANKIPAEDVKCHFGKD